jgi:hypothetical protein
MVRHPFSVLTPSLPLSQLLVGLNHEGGKMEADNVVVLMGGVFVMPSEVGLSGFGEVSVRELCTMIDGSFAAGDVVVFVGGVVAAVRWVDMWQMRAGY